MDPDLMFHIEAQPSFPPYPGRPLDQEADEVAAPPPHSSPARQQQKSDRLWKELIHRIKATRDVTEEAQANRKTLELSSAYRHSSKVIWPTSKKMQMWDLLILVTLFYTLVVTPFQVAFLLQTPLAIFILNRIVDVSLGVDMTIGMFLAYQTKETSTRSSGQWVTNLQKIREHYLKTWFVFDLVGLLSSMVEILEMVDSSSAPAARVIQAVRFFRLFRLARVFVRARSTLSMLIANAPTQVGFLAAEFLTWLLKLVMLAHLVACLFGYIAMTEEMQDANSHNWLKAAEASKSLYIDRDKPVQLYLMALYWAFTTLLTIGYGDITPQTIVEHAVCVVIMVAGGLAWTLLMATTCALATASDAQRLHHGMNMETLVRMCTDHGFPHDLTKRLVLFLVKSKRMELLVGQQQIMSKMSPSLQSEVAVHCTEHFLRGVDFCQGTETSFTRALASALRLQIFPPKEWIVPSELALYVQVVNDVTKEGAVKRGSRFFSQVSQLAGDAESAGPRVLRGYLDASQAPHLTILEGGLAVLGHIHCSGASWHKDLLLSQPYLRNQEVAQSVVFCSVYMLAREVLFATLGDSRFPMARSRVRKAAVKLAFVRMVTRAAQHAADYDYDLVAAASHVITKDAAARPISKKPPVVQPAEDPREETEERFLKAFEDSELRQMQMEARLTLRQEQLEKQMAQLCEGQTHMLSLLAHLVTAPSPPPEAEGGSRLGAITLD